MNSLIPFKMKMLAVLLFCIFMTFSMLVFVMKLTEKCESPMDEMCFHIKKNPIAKVDYFSYKTLNYTAMTPQILKPSFTISESLLLTKSTTEISNIKTKRTTREIFKELNISLNIYNYSLKNEIIKNLKQVPYHSASQKKKFSQYISFNNSTAFSQTSELISQNSSFSNLILDSFSTISNNLSLNVYKDRQKNLRQHCLKYFKPEQLYKIKRLKLNHVLIDEDHKILYCYVPKVACTNWKRIFMILTGQAHNLSQVINVPSSKIHAKHLFKSLQNYSIPEVQKLTQEYTKFIFVRHPFERLLSAYRNKLEQHYNSSKYFQARFGKYIIKNFRKNPSNVSLEKGDDVTFAEFANYLISSDPNLYNEHWQRITDLCHPCLINYDFIGKYETLIGDSNFLLKYLGFNVSFPILPKPSTTALNLKKYFNTLEKETIFKLYEIYKMDFKFFGYDLLNATDWLNS